MAQAFAGCNGSETLAGESVLTDISRERRIWPVS
jgi:hypothetical protein